MKITIELTPVGYLVVLETEKGLYHIVTTNKDKIREFVDRILKEVG
jgi:hypothetical protein